ncbi:tRNA (N6-isopentenyl adenosine(37)-C2)-methylthiotransferase MiaB [Acholeplasma sp. OttesenSCG-928-E16]|nr:tRNA (N6-isopentenyl adenosine(37)-C2)-methylthiotransferase MiaB [Acholeplasma sp. OttesenSCG-928-E16]
MSMKSKEELYEKYIKPSLSDARRRSNKDTEYTYFSLNPTTKTIGKGKYYYIETYGCQGNEADSETMAGILEAIGFKKASKIEESDIIILNTCAIRENAENRAWGELGRLKSFKRNNPDLIIGFAGCMPQEEKTIKRLLEKYPHIDIVFGTHNIDKLPIYVEEAMFNKERVIEVYSKEGGIVDRLPKSRNHQYKAWVNIMFGCDEFCTYCIVPYTRGKERSRKKEDIIEEVKKLVNDGYQEITLLGQNVNAYGKDIKNSDYTFGDLLNDLAKTKIPRIRFTTSHPHDLDQKTMDAIQNNDNVMPFFHLPVQSGSNTILKKMNRHYTREEYIDVVKRLKEAVPGISITTDIIVGFPNESEEDFQDTLSLVDECQFEGAFTFIFSPREGTPAATFDDSINPMIKKERLRILNKKINDLYLKGNKRFVNEIVLVLVDGPSKNDETILSGYTEHNKLVNFKGDAKMIGKIVEVRIVEARTWFLIGEQIEKN